jgi:hypothetical protein
MKLVPLSISLLTSIVPNMEVINFLHMLRPNPVPVGFAYLCSSNLLKSLNKFAYPSFEIPTPLSSIIISTCMNFITSSASSG